MLNTVSAFEAVYESTLSGKIVQARSVRIEDL
jgi:hypothetical protein